MSSLQFTQISWYSATLHFILLQQEFDGGPHKASTTTTCHKALAAVWIGTIKIAWKYGDIVDKSWLMIMIHVDKGYYGLLTIRGLDHLDPFGNLRPWDGSNYMILSMFITLDPDMPRSTWMGLCSCNWTWFWGSIDVLQAGRVTAGILRMQYDCFPYTPES